MDVIIIAKNGFAIGELRDVKNIAYNSSTMYYTLTKADNTTVQYSGVDYYLQFIWG